MTFLLEVNNLSVVVATESGARPILRGVSLTIDAGEAMGLVGESGSGKSMTAKAITCMLPTGASMSGSIVFDGRDVPHMSRRDLRDYRQGGVSFIPQDPRSAINPVHRVGDFLTEPLTVLKRRTPAQAASQASAALADVGIKDGTRVLDQYPHELSGGMLQRVMICSALLSGSRLIVADEPTTALDVTTQSEVMAILDELRRERGLALLFISHDLELAAAICDRISVMYAGQIVECQPATELERAPLHPYTHALFASRPSITAAPSQLSTIPGRARAAFEVTHGCGFADRCRYVQERCTTEGIALTGPPAHQVRCWRSPEISAHFGEVNIGHDQ